MSESKHTPGPWVDLCDNGYTIAVVPAGRHGNICAFATPPSPANARLIAAAPDLLEALQLVCATMGQSNDWRDDSQMARKARAAIAKAALRQERTG